MRQAQMVGVLWTFLCGIFKQSRAILLKSVAMPQIIFLSNDFRLKPMANNGYQNLNGIQQKLNFLFVFRFCRSTCKLEDKRCGNAWLGTNAQKSIMQIKTVLITPDILFISFRENTTPFGISSKIVSVEVVIVVLSEGGLQRLCGSKCFYAKQDKENSVSTKVNRWEAALKILLYLLREKSVNH